MVFRHLPTPILVPFLFLCAFATLYYAVRSRFKENNLMVMGYYFWGIAFGFLGFAKLFMQNYQDVSVIILMVLLVTAPGLFVLGALKKFKDDPLKRRQLMLCIYVMMGSIGLVALIVLFELLGNV